GPTPPRRSASRSACATLRKAGAITCTGTSNWTRRDPLPFDRVMPRPQITGITPLSSVEGGRITIYGSGFPVEEGSSITVGDQQARVVFASGSRIAVVVPADLEGGPTA